VIVDEVWAGEVGHRCFLSLLPFLDHTLTGFSGLVASGLDVITVQPRFAAHVLVGVVVERGLACRDVLSLESVVCHVVSGPQKLVYGVVEKCGVGAVHIEFDWNSTPLLHISYVKAIFQKRWDTGCAVVG
jgi:hypothetical protein